MEALQPQPACRLVWAVPCSLAATYGISSISLPLVTKMFQFTRCPSHDLCIQSWMTRRYPRRVSPFGYLRITPFVLVPGAFRCLHVLLRHPVPRHSPRTLCSFQNMFVKTNAFLTRCFLRTSYVPLYSFQNALATSSEPTSILGAFSFASFQCVGEEG